MRRLFGALGAAVIVALGVGALALTVDEGSGASIVAAELDQEACIDYETQDQIEKETRTLLESGSWTAWVDWPGAGAVWDDGRNRGPAHHGGATHGQVGDRDYRYVVVGSRQVPIKIPCPTTTTSTLPETTTSTLPETTTSTLPETTTTTLPETTTTQPDVTTTTKPPIVTTTMKPEVTIPTTLPPLVNTLPETK